MDGRFLVCSLLSICLAPAAMAQEPLRYKFRKGQQLDYEVAIAARIFGQDGQTVVADTNQLFDVALVVKDVDPNGTATMQRRLTRVRIALKLPDRNLDFDSNDPRAGEAAFGELVAKSIERIIRSEMTQQLTAGGRLDRFELAVDLNLLLKENPQLALSGLGEANLRNVANMAALELPTKPLKVGDAWKKVEEMPQPAFVQTTTTEFVFQGEVDRQGKKLLRFDLKPSIAIAGKPGSSDSFKLKSQTHSGQAFFDPVLGQPVELETKSRIVIDFSAGGQTGLQDVAYQNTVRLKRAE